MSSLQDLPRSLPLTHAPLQRPAILPRRNLSPKEEKEALIRKIESVSASNATLSARQDHLNSCVPLLSLRSTTCGSCWSSWDRKVRPTVKYCTARTSSCRRSTTDLPRHCVFRIRTATICISALSTGESSYSDIHTFILTKPPFFSRSSIA